MIVELLRNAAIALGILLALTALFTLGNSVAGAVRARRRSRRVTALNGALTRLLLGDGDVDAAAAAAVRLPPRTQAEILGAIGRSVFDEQRSHSRAIAERTGLVATAAGRCRSRRWTVRLFGVRLLAEVGASPPADLDLLADRVDAVRAEATRFVVAQPTPDGTQRLVDLLSDPAHDVRFAAKDALVRCGVHATTTVAAHLTRPDCPSSTVTDLLDIAVRIAQPALVTVVEARRGDPDPAVRAGAAQLAAAIGSTGTGGALRDLLRDHHAEVRAAAATGLGQLGHWPAAPALATCLRDPVWAVRHAAGLALRRLGAPGELYLRRALSDGDAFARDTARQVLDLPRLRVVA